MLKAQIKYMNFEMLLAIWEVQLRSSVHRLETKPTKHYIIPPEDPSLYETQLVFGCQEGKYDSLSLSN